MNDIQLKYLRNSALESVKFPNKGVQYSALLYKWIS